MMEIFWWFFGACRNVTASTP